MYFWVSQVSFFYRVSSIWILFFFFWLTCLTAVYCFQKSDSGSPFLHVDFMYSLMKNSCGSFSYGFQFLCLWFSVFLSLENISLISIVKLWDILFHLSNILGLPIKHLELHNLTYVPWDGPAMCWKYFNFPVLSCKSHTSSKMFGNFYQEHTQTLNL